MVVASIHDLNIHDSELIEVLVNKDNVVMLLDYIDDYETMKCSRKRLVFSGCSEAHFKINPDYASPNSILRGDESQVGNQRKVRIEMNTTAAVIEVMAAEIELID